MKRNVEPLPSVALAQMRPPIASTSGLLIARPSPVPPNLRVVLASACVNAWNRRQSCSGVDADAGVAHRDLDLVLGVLPS